jgi:7-carboxy-7-deazaguanine synthase
VTDGPLFDTSIPTRTGDVSETRRQALHRPGWPVIELFGPVVQGEGPAAGKPCYFVRFGGCDYRCSWCDSMYAVDPEEVRENATRLNAVEIRKEIERLPEGPHIVILSGGNPALHHLQPLVTELQSRGKIVHVETQGSVWRPWLGNVNQLVISPKPPSSGMVNPNHTRDFADFMTNVYAANRPGDWVALKVVVADKADYKWAQGVHRMYPEVPFYLSVMTPQELPEGIVDSTGWLRYELGERYKWLCEQAATDPLMADVVLLPQLHVIAHGAARGV